DPDREGEAISWHLAALLGIDPGDKCRIAFNEITKTAVKEAVTKPRCIDEDLVDAQQARRVLDRIVGYQLSPLLWKKVKKGLSAGRVQSVATKLIVDREREIEAFQEEEYWTIDVKLTDEKGKKPFVAKFHGKSSSAKMTLSDSETTYGIVEELKNSSYTVDKIVRSEKKKYTAPPFTTSTLQQEAARKLNFTTKRTMATAQQLYEGIDIKGIGSVGLITYMRTDSLRVSSEAQRECRGYIGERFGMQYVPDKPKFYRSKKSAQDAHEAIRPTSMAFDPEKIKDSLKADQYKLYKLIWNRFVASQMTDAILDTLQAYIKSENYVLKASGVNVKFDGFMAVYVESQDYVEEKEGKIPQISQGQILLSKEIEPKQHFTQPPARYTEASLVKKMEEDGIGRPSTYAPTITTITSSRGYVARDGKSLYPTELGMIVTKLMEEHFPDIVDVEFTANMEQKLDSVEEGKKEWKEIIEDFYKPFATTLSAAEEAIGKIEVQDEVSDIACEKCGRMMVYKQGRFGKFLACPGYPECKNTKSIVEEIDALCPNCGGKVQVKKSKKGAKYYTCEKGTDCFISWDEP
ncbi:MAG: type I DNA topoisomerase, partial [Clostridia bacterium]|nr:type I DNA topoisomerase [Clostridia bacterium]